LKNIFDKQPDVKRYFDKQPDKKFAASWDQNLQQARGMLFTNSNNPWAWWCS
jgi:hypothetical protein